MPRTKGTKTGKPVIVDDKFVEEYMKGADGVEADPYLVAMFHEFKRQVDEVVPKKRSKHLDKRYRYSPLQMWNNVCRYFEATILMGNPLTVSGMGRFLGMTSQGLFTFRKNPNLDDGYNFIHDCIAFIEMYNEISLHKRQNPAGSIFVLKNMGWKDKIELDARVTAGALTDEERVAAQRRLAKFNE
jgi:hypothetical protein